MEIYFVIVQNTLEVLELGQYNSLLEAERDRDQIEHLSHGEPYIIVGEKTINLLASRIENLNWNK
jgi:hypothetical protein